MKTTDRTLQSSTELWPTIKAEYDNIVACTLALADLASEDAEAETKPTVRLIDADVAAKEFMVLAKEPDYQHECEDWRSGLYMAEEVLDRLPAVCIEELINEIYLGVRRECVDEDGFFMPGAFMNLILDIKQKYGVK